METSQITVDNGGVNNSNVIRWSGLVALAAGLIYIAIQPVHPTDIISSVTSSTWLGVHVASLFMDFLGLIGITGLYAMQSHKAGWIGLTGFLLLSIFYVLSFAFHFVEAFISPVLITESPRFVEGLLGLVSGHSSEISLGNIPVLFGIFGISYLFGGLLFGIATYRANILPRWSGMLLAAGAVMTVLGSVIPHPLNRAMAIPVGLALIWMGYAAFINSAKQKK